MVFTQRKDTPNLFQVEFIQLDFSQDILPQIFDVLYQEKLQSLMVEGGSILLQSFIESECWDEAYVEHSSDYLKEGIKAPKLTGEFDFFTEEHFGRNIEYAIRKASR